MRANDPKLIPLRIRLPYGSEQEFIERYGSNVARGGIFIATRAIKAEGTAIAFELVLEDGTRLMRGEGVVQKTQVDEGGARSGMTVRFVRLDSRSKALVDRVIALRSGLAGALPPDPEAMAVKTEPASHPPRAPPGLKPAARAQPSDAARAAGSAPTEDTGEVNLAPSADPDTPLAAPVRTDSFAPEMPGVSVHAEGLGPNGQEAVHPEPATGPRPEEPAAPSDEPPAAAESPLESALAASASAAPDASEVPREPSRTVPRARHEEEVLGIDLGTTNSRVAVFQDGAARLVPQGPDGRAFAIPSVIARDEKGRFLVGGRAKARILSDPQNTIFGAKRLIGRRARSAKVREIAGRFPYRLVPDANGDAGVELHGEVFTLPELFALLLTELKQSAQEFLGKELSRAVLCVPAYFNDHQRSAMIDAGQRAGLEILRILNEPSAVALAFGYGRGLARKRLLVCDLGGGTFDASVLELTGDDIEVVTTGGDNFLGGIDFDLRMVDQLSLALPEEDRARLQASLHAAQRLRDAAEQAKIALSEEEVTAVHLPVATARDDGTPVDLRTEVTRARLEEITSDLVERSIEVTRAVLEAGGIRREALDEVLLVGGQSRAPLVRRKLEEFLDRPVRTEVDAHAAVAMGAAILGHSIVQSQLGRTGITLSEVLSAPIGIGVKGGRLQRVLDRNTPLPAEKTIAVPIRSGQPLGLAIFQGGSLVAEENEYLGALHATCDRDGELALNFRVTPDGKLDLSASGPGGFRAELSFSTADASDETRAALLALAPLPGEESLPDHGLFRGLKRLFGRS